MSQFDEVLAEINLQGGSRLCLVREHWRARPGEAGSEIKPINVREHVREISAEGKVKKLSWTCDPTEFSAELFNAMTEVIKVTELPTKRRTWTLTEATFVLEKGLRYSKDQRQWYWLDGKRGSKFFNRSIIDTMNAIDAVLKYRDCGGPTEERIRLARQKYADNQRALAHRTGVRSFK